MNHELRTNNGATPAYSAESASENPPNLANSVYERLKDDILGCELPPGTRLRVDFVRERYGIGSSPVREALTRLAAEGFIKREENRGFFVAGVSAEEFHELTETRCWVEELALRRSIQDGGEAWEEAIVLAFHRLSRAARPAAGTMFRPANEWVRRHDLFHDSLISACGSRWLREFCSHLRDQAYRYRRTTSEERTAGSLVEHEMIMKAALNREADRAVQLLAEHYRTTAEITLRRYRTMDDRKRRPKKKTR